MSDFSNSTSLMKHEMKREHLDLMYKQALGEDTGSEGENRSKSRYRLCGFDIEENPWEYPNPDLFFCRCRLGWRIEKCKVCSDAPVDGNQLYDAIYNNYLQNHVHVAQQKDRNNILGKALQAESYYENYDPMAVAKSKKKKMKEPSLIKRFQQVVSSRAFNRKQHRIERHMGMSPLIPSYLRQETPSKVPLQKIIPRRVRSLPGKSKAVLNQVLKRPINLIAPSEEIVLARSPLAPSYVRRDMLLPFDDRLTEFEDKMYHTATTIKSRLLHRKGNWKLHMQQRQYSYSDKYSGIDISGTYDYNNSHFTSQHTAASGRSAKKSSGR